MLKIPVVSSLVKKADFNTKVIEIEGKISDASNLLKKTDLDTKLKRNSDRVTRNKSKHLLVENELKKLKEFDLSYFRGESYFGDNNITYLVFEVSLKYLNFYDESFYKPVLSWNSRGVPKEIIKAPRSNNNILSPTTENTFDHQKIKLKFNGSCLVHDQITYTPQTRVNVYIVCEITKKSSISDYSGYGIGFDRKGEFSFGNGFGQNVIIFGADMSSSIHSTNKTKYFSSR